MMESKIITLSKKVLNRLPYNIRFYLYHLKERYCLYQTNMVDRGSNVFFIVGSQRSGTTLLGLILDSHSRIKIYDEEISYDCLKKSKFYFDEVHQNIGFKIPVWTHRYNLLKKKFPNAKYIFLKRNIKAVVSSMINLKIYGIPWIRYYGINDLERSIPEISKKAIKNHILQRYFLYKKNNDWVMLATLCVCVKNFFYHQIKEKDKNIYLVDYDQLIENPVKQIGNILQFLDVDWEDKVLKHHLHKPGIAIGSTSRSRPIDQDSLKKWKKYLKHEDVENIENEYNHLKKIMPIL